jgi:hypothetical protein
MDEIWLKRIPAQPNTMSVQRKSVLTQRAETVTNPKAMNEGPAS